MIRYRGEALPDNARIAVISNDALGNFVVVTPLLQMLRDKFSPACLDYYGGVRTWELQIDSDLFDYSFPLHGSPPSELMAVASERRGYDLVINVERANGAKFFAGSLCTSSSMVCGPCGDMPGSELPYPDDSRGDLWRDRDWTAEDLTERYPFLKTPFIGEIFCRLCYLEGPIPSYKVNCIKPSMNVPPILISTAAAVDEKLWPGDRWLQMLAFFKEQGLEAGLIGANPVQQQQFWRGNDAEDELVASGLVTDLRGRLTLPEVVGALRACRFVLSLDNGILHLAIAAKKKTVGIFRYGIHRLWAPPSEYLTVLAPSKGGKVTDITVDSVRDAVNRALR